MSYKSLDSSVPEPNCLADTSALVPNMTEHFGTSLMVRSVVSEVSVHHFSTNSRQ